MQDFDVHPTLPGWTSHGSANCEIQIEKKFEQKNLTLLLGNMTVKSSRICASFQVQKPNEGF